MYAIHQAGDKSSLTDSELYDKLVYLKLPEHLLENYNYPVPNPIHPTARKIQRCGNPIRFIDGSIEGYKCRRCRVIFRVDFQGLPLASFGTCTHHPAKWLYPDNIYKCCLSKDKFSTGCSTSQYHVHEGERSKEKYEGFVHTKDKPEKEPNKHGIFSLDCEMSFTIKGLELTRITVMNHKFEVVYETFVKPYNKILDYNTRFSGITESDMIGVTTRFDDVQEKLLDLFSSKTLLVGHGLDHDLDTLKLFHTNVIDTAYLYRFPDGRTAKRKLKDIVLDVFGEKIQESMGHDSKEDAKAALKLVLSKVGIKE